MWMIGAEPCWFCLPESWLCIDLLDDERMWLEDCELLRADTSDSSTLVYCISSVFFSSLLLAHTFFPAIPLHSLPLFLWCPECTTLSWCCICGEVWQICSQKLFIVFDSIVPTGSITVEESNSLPFWEKHIINYFMRSEMRRWISVSCKCAQSGFCYSC